VLQKIVYTFLFIFSVFAMSAQTATISGIVKDSDGVVISGAEVAVLEDGSKHTTTDASGFYSLEIPANKAITISIFNLSYKQQNKKIIAKEGEKINYSPQLDVKNVIALEVVYEKNRNVEMTTIDPKNIFQIPSPTGNLEDIIKTQMGVSSNNELTSGYSVRGGNFDENLVYVNDIEVYRPFLARSGQQEGLSFANPDMVSNINFSAGGFEAKYGDKMSSVLDITYKKPQKFGGTVSGSLLGGALHLQGVSKNRVLAWSIGSRYKSNSYLLNTNHVFMMCKPS
jgi:hypothetical protein